jgi:hypothetical protein
MKIFTLLYAYIIKTAHLSNLKAEGSRPLRNLGVHRRIILKWVLKIWGIRMWTAFMWLKTAFSCSFS